MRRNMRFVERARTIHKVRDFDPATKGDRELDLIESQLARFIDRCKSNRAGALLAVKFFTDFQTFFNDAEMNRWLETIVQLNLRDSQVDLEPEIGRARQLLLTVRNEQTRRALGD